VLWLLGLATGAMIGCQGPPRAILGDLPGDSILEPAGRTAPAGRGAGAAAGRDWLPSGYERPWQYVVIHHSATEAGSAQVFDRAHRARGWDELGYHFVIDNGNGGRNGQVEVGGRWTKQKWGAHTGGTPNNEYNNYGIGVCLVGDFSTDLPSPEQLASLRRLLAFLTERYQIDPSRILGHRDAPGANTTCPGDALERYLYQVLRPELHRR
jgi:hypothetical protein